MLSKMPNFTTEAKEADRCFEQRHEIAKAFERVKPKPGPSAALMALARKRGISFEELQAKLRAHAAEPEPSPALPRSA
jgi:hypothetical protein